MAVAVEELLALPDEPDHALDGKIWAAARARRPGQRRPPATTRPREVRDGGRPRHQGGPQRVVTRQAQAEQVLDEFSRRGPLGGGADRAAE
jgi:hypothetical protein